MENVSTQGLLKLHANLLRGLDKVVAHIDAGTLDVSPAPKVCPPRAGGQLTVALLGTVEKELAVRGVQIEDRVV